MRFDVFFSSRITQPHLVQLEADNLKLDDDALLAISNTNCAKSLKRLRAFRSIITAASALAWSRWSALEELDLSACRSLDYETLHSLSLLPCLRSLDAWGEVKRAITIEEVENLFGPNKFPLLRKLDLDLTKLVKVASKRAKVLDILARRSGVLTTLVIAWQVSDPDLIEIHTRLPQLTRRISQVDVPSLDTVLSLLPHMSNFRELSFGETDGNITADHLQLIATSCPSLENLVLVAHNTLLCDDFSMFSSLTSLHARCPNQHMITKFPPTLTWLTLDDSTCPVDPVSDETKRRFYDGICCLTKLKTLWIEVNAQLTSTPFLASIIQNLTNLQDFHFYVFETANAVPQVPSLNNLPSCFRIALDAPGIRLDTSSLYLPAITGTGNQVSLPWNCCSPYQLPNLTSFTHDENTLDIAEFFQRFAPQLRKFDGPLEGSISQLFSFSSLEELDLKTSLKRDGAKAILQSLGRLHKLGASIDVESSDCSWIKHSRLATLKLSLLNVGGVEPHFRFSSQDTPCLFSLTLSFHSFKKVSVQISGLKNLWLLNLEALGRSSDPRPEMSFDISSCALLSTIRFHYINFESFQVRDMKLKNVCVNSVRFPGDTEDRKSIPDWFK